MDSTFPPSLRNLSPIRRQNSEPCRPRLRPRDPVQVPAPPPAHPSRSNSTARLLRRARPPPFSPRFQSPQGGGPRKMAVLNLASGGFSDKENAPPSAARGIAVKKQSAMKRPGCSKARNRPPLRDITYLFLAGPFPSEEPAAAEALRALAGAPSNGVATKPGRYSLRKGFR